MCRAGLPPSSSPKGDSWLLSGNTQGRHLPYIPCGKLLSAFFFGQRKQLGSAVAVNARNWYLLYFCVRKCPVCRWGQRGCWGKHHSHWESEISNRVLETPDHHHIQSHGANSCKPQSQTCSRPPLSSSSICNQLQSRVWKLRGTLNTLRPWPSFLFRRQATQSRSTVKLHQHQSRYFRAPLSQVSYTFKGAADCLWTSWSSWNSVPVGRGGHFSTACSIESSFTHLLQVGSIHLSFLFPCQPDEPSLFSA